MRGEDQSWPWIGWFSMLPGAASTVPLGLDDSWKWIVALSLASAVIFAPMLFCAKSKLCGPNGR